MLTIVRSGLPIRDSPGYRASCSYLACDPVGCGTSGPDDRNGLRSATLRLGVPVAAAADDGAVAGTSPGQLRHGGDAGADADQDAGLGHLWLDGRCCRRLREGAKHDARDLTNRHRLVGYSPSLPVEQRVRRKSYRRDCCRI